MKFKKGEQVYFVSDQQMSIHHGFVSAYMGDKYIVECIVFEYIAPEHALFKTENEAKAYIEQRVNEEIQQYTNLSDVLMHMFDLMDVTPLHKQAMIEAIEKFTGQKVEV